MSHPFEANDVFEWAEAVPGRARYVRVLHVPPDASEVALIAAPDPEALPRWVDVDGLAAEVGTGKLLQRRPDPLLDPACADSRLSAPASRRIAERWELVRDLLEDPDRRVLSAVHRGSLVAEAALRHRACRSTIYRHLRQYWQGGQFKNALLPAFDRCGALGEPRKFSGVKLGVSRNGPDPRGGVHGPSLKEMIREAIPLIRREGMSLPRARTKVLIENYGERVLVDGLPEWRIPDGTPLPSVDQFRYWVTRALGRGELAAAKLGRANWRKDHAAKVGSLRSKVRGPGELYQIDSTLCDFMLRSAHKPERLVGRPVLYLVTDVYSGLIAGFHVGLKPPSTREMRLALENAFTCKVEFCASMGIVIEPHQWPARHRASEYLTDGGPEYKTKFLEGVGYDLDKKFRIAPPYSPTLKALVENKFSLLNIDLLSWLPGSWRKRERGDQRCKLDAIYDLRGFRKAMTLWIIEHNAKRTPVWPKGWVSPDGSDPKLTEVWAHGRIRNGGPPTVDPELVREALLERTEISLQQRGFMFNTRRYVPEDEAELAWLASIPNGRFPKRTARYDTRDITTMQVDAADKRMPSKQYRLAPNYSDFEGWSEDEFEDHEAWRRDGRRKKEVADINERGRFATDQEALIASKRAEMGSIVAKAGPDGTKVDRKSEVLAEAGRARAARVAAGAVPGPSIAAAPRSFAPDFGEVG